MPCNTRTIVSLDLKVSDVDLLFDAVKELKVLCKGHRLSTDAEIRRWAEEVVKTGKVRLVAGYEYLVDSLRQKYAEKAVRKAASKFGWVCTGLGETRLILRR